MATAVAIPYEILDEVGFHDTPPKIAHHHIPAKENNSRTPETMD
ncbi:hypothetical protein [Candidatus Spongiihabitans sp.]